MMALTRQRSRIVSLHILTRAVDLFMRFYNLRQLCCKDNFEARKVVGSIPLCRDLKEA